MTTKFGLGRGLSALIPNAQAPAPVVGGAKAVLVVPPERIHPNPKQPRQSFPTSELEELVTSIREHGILQPLIVVRRSDGDYELVMGERRLRAAKLAGLATVPVIVRDGEDDGRTKLILALVENIQRQDLNAIDRAFAFRQLQEEFGFTQEEIAARVGISRSAVAHVLRLLCLPPEIQNAIREGRITEGHAKVLAGITDPREQRAWFDRITKEQLPISAIVTAQTAAVTRRRGAAPASSVDANLRAKESALQQRLGAKVRITPKGRGGAIIITYNDAEELAGIIRMIVR